MAHDPDVRWRQRFENFEHALAQLSKFVEKGDLNEMEAQGLIQCFEYAYELARNTLKDLFEDEGETGILGSRDAFRLAFRRGLIEDGKTWMEMIKSRVLTSHTYNEDLAQKVGESIVGLYYPEFLKLKERLGSLKERPA